MVGAGALHFAAAVLCAAPEVAAADHNADLHAHRHTLGDRVTDAADHRKIQSGLFLPGKRLAADLQQDALEFGRRIFHRTDSPTFRIEFKSIDLF